MAAELGTHPGLADAPVQPCVPSPRTAGYRNQAKYVYGRAPGAGEIALGAYASRSHTLVDLAGCCVVEPIVEATRQAVLAILVENAVAPFDEIRRTGVLRYVVVRATASQAVLVTLVAARGDWPEAERVAEALARACPVVAGVVLNLNPSTGNTVFGAHERLLAGHATVVDEIGDVRVQLASRSFFQINRQVASRIYRDLVAATPARFACAVDAYAGAGGIALSLAPRAREILAIEDNPSATGAATALLAESGRGGANVRFLTGDAARCLAGVAAADVLVLNPPRRGCAAEVLAAVLRLRPSLVAYLSCEPKTLARDLAVLVGGGARLVRATPYDMMPHTPHVETLALVQLDSAG